MDWSSGSASQVLELLLYAEEVIMWRNPPPQTIGYRCWMDYWMDRGLHRWDESGTVTERILTD